jgi:hypothetical protein
MYKACAAAYASATTVSDLLYDGSIEFRLCVITSGIITAGTFCLKLSGAVLQSACIL